MRRDMQRLLAVLLVVVTPLFVKIGRDALYRVPTQEQVADITVATQLLADCLALHVERYNQAACVRHRARRVQHMIAGEVATGPAIFFNLAAAIFTLLGVFAHPRVRLLASACILCGLFAQVSFLADVNEPNLWRDYGMLAVLGCVMALSHMRVGPSVAREHAEAPAPMTFPLADAPVTTSGAIGFSELSNRGE